MHRLKSVFSVPAVVLLSLLLPLGVAALPSRDAPLAPLPEHREVAGEIVARLERHHYASRRFDDQLSAELLENYLENLDGGKMFLLENDIQEFSRYRHELDDALRAGKLEAAFEIFNRYQQRVIARLSEVTDDIEAEIAALDFGRDETLDLDRENDPWPADAQAARELWRKNLKNQVLNLKLAGKPAEEIAPLLAKRYSNQLKRVRQYTSEDVFQIYMNSLTELYDPHTNYLSPRSSENFNINMSLKLEGIGAVLQMEDEYTKVVRLVHAGPADKQGELQPADRIVAVAQGKEGEFQDVIGWRLDDVVDLIRGPKGTVVRLEVIPANAVGAGADERKTIRIVRNEVKLEEQSAQKKVMEVWHGGRTVKLGVIDVPAFYVDFDAKRAGDLTYKSTTRDVRNLLGELMEEGVEGVIIDLRNNGGGSLQEANDLTGLFIESGPTVQIRASNERVFRDGKRRRTPYYDGPLVVLINRLSASASEIFAGAIQDYQRGLIIGSQSFGKGTVQSLAPLQRGQLKLTESKFYRISGESTQHRGVVPDIEFPVLYDHKQVGESALDHALTWDTIDPVRHRVYFDIRSELAELQQAHLERSAKDPDFAYLRAQAALMKELSERDAVPLNEEKRRALQSADKAKRLALENQRRKAKGLEPLATLEEASAEESDEVAAEDNANSVDVDDPLLVEAGHILADALQLYTKPVLAYRNYQPVSRSE